MSTKLPGNNPTAYLGIKETNPPQLYFRNRAPLSTDARPYDTGDIWLDQTAREAYILVLKIGPVATWIGMAGVGALESLTGDVGGPVFGDGAENINLLGSGGITVTGNPGTNTLTISGIEVDEQQIIYVGKHGNDANDGFTIEKAKLTFGAAITAAGAISPASIVCFDGGTYTETLTLVANVNIDAKNAILTGSFDLVDDSHVTFNRVNVVTATIGILKSTGTGKAYANVEEIVCAGTGDGCISNAGTIFLNFDFIEVEDGNGIGDFAGTGVGINFDGREINTINAAANGIATGAPTLITGYVGTILGGGRGINAVGSCRVIANQINTNLGVRVNNGDLEIFCNELIATTAVLLVGTGILNLHAIRITGTVTTPVGTTYNFISAEDGINTKESFIGTTHSISNTNTDNTNTSSHAQLETIAGGAAGGDPFLHLEVDSVTDYSFGIDNSDSDILKITDGADPSTGNELYSLTSGGDGAYPQTGALGLNSGTTGERPGAPVNGMIRYNSTTNLFEGYENGVWINFGSGGAGSLVQQVRVNTLTFDTATTLIPVDDTIPQQTEGDELFTLAITPTNASNILKFDFSTMWAPSLSTLTATFALFQDATAAAIFAIADRENTVSAHPLAFNFYMTAGTASSTTFKIRFGPVAAGTIGVNATPATGPLGRVFGGVAATSLIISEIKV
jgi:hypothetical protein